MKLKKISAIAVLLGALFYVNSLFAALAFPFDTCAEPATLYKKATTITGFLYDYSKGDYIGTSTMKIAKISKKGTVKVTLTLTPFFGSKISASGTFKPNSCGIIDDQIKFKNGLVFSFIAGREYENDTTLSFECYDTDYLYAHSCPVGGEIPKDEYAVRVNILNKPYLPVGYSTIDPYSYPEWTFGKYNGSKFDFDKAPKMKYDKVDDGDGGYDYVLAFSGEGTNTNALNLKYNKKNGSLTGSFKFYYSNAENLVKGKKKPTLRSVQTKIKGCAFWGQIHYAAAQFKYKKQATNFNVWIANGIR